MTISNCVVSSYFLYQHNSFLCVGFDAAVSHNPKRLSIGTIHSTSSKMFPSVGFAIGLLVYTTYTFCVGHLFLLIFQGALCAYSMVSNLNSNLLSLNFCTSLSTYAISQFRQCQLLCSIRLIT
uniref:7TM_GPCR_Srx domain-containing protein n=1 Tax=Steinernema glaseri TaxID=37863 RepID=A0A1I8ACT9_9BILA